MLFCEWYANIYDYRLPMTIKNGGEGGIRTLGGVTPTHPFQGCTIGHSVTSPLNLI